MSDGGDFEKLETYSREPRLSHSDLTRWFMSHALRQYSGRNLTMLKHVVRDTKALHEDFMESPTIGFCVFVSACRIKLFERNTELFFYLYRC